MILRPDEYAHQNDDLSIVDSSNVRGGRRVVQDLQELYGLHQYQDKLKDNVTIVRVNSEDKDYRLINKSMANVSSGWTVNSISSPPEILISKTEPIDTNIKLWGKLPLTDLDILRQIRDANPSSQLPALWLDSEDPYTQWEGVMWWLGKVSRLTIYSMGLTTLPNINKLTYLDRLEVYDNRLTQLDLSNMPALRFVACGGNNLNNLNLSNTLNLTGLGCQINNLPNLSTLTARRNITLAIFSQNKFNSAEVTRLLGIGFTDQEIGTQNQ